MIDLNTIWYILIGTLIAGYAILDGFDLGVGILHLFARKEEDRNGGINAIAPVWDGNEVWLITAGGALFAAFPVVYATVFSGFYLALMLVLAALIFRAVSIEFRNKKESASWKKTWDWGFGWGSLAAALLFGVAVGNILRGVPIDGDLMWAGSFFGLMNPYSILIGLLTIALFAMHGALYLALKTEGDLQKRMSRFIPKIWLLFLILYILATVWSILGSSYLFTGVWTNPLFYIFLALIISGIVLIPIWNQAGAYFKAFLASSGTILGMVGAAAVSLFPRLVPSSIDLGNSLDIYNASSNPYTLKVMLIIVLIGFPIVIAYTIWVYRIFKGKIADGY